jgi:hypothetical protein
LLALYENQVLYISREVARRIKQLVEHFLTTILKHFSHLYYVTSASRTPPKIMTLSSELSSATSNTEFYLAHIGAWCNLHLENEHVSSLQLSDVSSTSPYNRSTPSSTSTKTMNPKPKPSSVVSKADMQLAPTEALLTTILESRQVNYQQVSNHFAASPSPQIEDSKTTCTSKSKISRDRYDYGHARDSTMVQKWLDEAHEEEPFVLIGGTHEASHWFWVGPCSWNGYSSTAGY